MRVKIPDLQMALEGRFDDHHALMCQLHLAHIDHLEAMITKLDAQVGQMMEPFRAARDLLTTIPGIGPLAAPARRRNGNEHLQSLLVECAWAAVRHPGYLKSLYHRHVMKWGGYRSKLAKKKAIVVVAHAMIVIIWHVLATGRPCDELGEDYFDRRQDPGREIRRLTAKLEAVSGRQVILQAAA